MKTIGVKFRTENIKTLTEGIRIKKKWQGQRSFWWGIKREKKLNIKMLKKRGFYERVLVYT